MPVAKTAILHSDVVPHNPFWFCCLLLAFWLYKAKFTESLFWTKTREYWADGRRAAEFRMVTSLLLLLWDPWVQETSLEILFHTLTMYKSVCTNSFRVTWESLICLHPGKEPRSREKWYPGCHSSRHKLSLVSGHTQLHQHLPPNLRLSHGFPPPPQLEFRQTSQPFQLIWGKGSILKRCLFPRSVLVTHDHGSSQTYFFSHVLASLLTFFLAILLLKSSRA